MNSYNNTNDQKQGKAYKASQENVNKNHEINILAIVINILAIAIMSGIAYGIYFILTH